MIHNEWGVTKYPIVAGHEGIGRVVRTGSMVKDLEVGTLVGIGWISGSCGTCDACRVGQDNLCRKGYQGTIMFGHRGCFASHVRLQARWALPLPADIDIDSAGPLLCAGITVFSPLKRWVRPLHFLL